MSAAIDLLNKKEFRYQIKNLSDGGIEVSATKKLSNGYIIGDKQIITREWLPQKEELLMKLFNRLMIMQENVLP